MKKTVSLLLIAGFMLIFFCSALATGSDTAGADEGWICSSCGSKVIGNFCSNCGAPKPEEEVTAEAGTTNDDDTDIDEIEDIDSIDSNTEMALNDSGELSFGDLFPNEDIWGKSPEEIKNNSGRIFEETTISKNYALKTTDIPINKYKIEAYYVFKDNIGLSQIIYLMPEAKELSKDDRTQFAITLIEETKNVLGDPQSQEKQTSAIWEEDAYSVKVGGVKFKGEKMVGIILTSSKNDAPLSENATRADNTSEDYKLIKDYKWSSYNNYEGLVIRNTSGSTKDYDAKVMFYDKNNQLIGVGNFSADVVAAGQEALILCSNEAAFDHIDYTISAKDSRYSEVQSFIDIQIQIADNKAILIAKNNGNVAAQFVQYNCLFINGKGQVVGTGWGYLTDDDSELKPGMTEFREESCYEPFKTVELYFTGRS